MPFFLIAVGVLLIILNLKAIKSDKASFRLLVKDKEREITDFDVAIGELRREFSETILELQQEIYRLEEKINAKAYSKDERELIIENELKETVLQPKDEVLEDKVIIDESSNMDENNVRIKEIGQLLKQGISLEDICEKYNIGKGEVLLIRELYLR